MTSQAVGDARHKRGREAEQPTRRRRHGHSRRNESSMIIELAQIRPSRVNGMRWAVHWRACPLRARWDVAAPSRNPVAAHAGPQDMVQRCVRACFSMSGLDITCPVSIGLGPVDDGGPWQTERALRSGDGVP